MSDQNRNDPFATPGSGAPEWQGTPVPPPPTVVPLPPGYLPPPPAQPLAAPGMAAYPPVPPVGYMYAPVYNPAGARNNWMGTASLILSLSSFIFGITCIPGVIFGHMGLSAAKKGTANNRGLALAGVIIGWVFVGFGLLFVAYVVAAIVIGASGS